MTGVQTCALPISLVVDVAVDFGLVGAALGLFGLHGCADGLPGGLYSSVVGGGVDGDGGGRLYDLGGGFFGALFVGPEIEVADAGGEEEAKDADKAVDAADALVLVLVEVGFADEP